MLKTGWSMEREVAAYMFAGVTVVERDGRYFRLTVSDT